jgi:threonine dehydrogenase-like Zn-dependent dehydrogenase
MIAAILTKPKTFEFRETTIPVIGPDEVKIKVNGCGICASSIPVWEGREWFNYPLEPGSPGHEGWGVVEEAGSEVKKVQAGDHVAFLSYHAYAAYDTAKENAFVKLPAALNNKAFPGEPLGCAMNIFNRSNVTENDVVAIIGIGFLGALLCQLAKKRGAKVIAVSRRPYSLAFAEKFGADEVVPLTNTWDVTGKVSEITGGAFCSRVIEATGKQEGIDVASAIVAEGGKMIIAGYHQDGMRQVNMQTWNWKGIDVINAHERDPLKYLSGMELAVEAVIDGTMQTDLLFTHLLSLDELSEGFELTRNRPDGFMKALIQF